MDDDKGVGGAVEGFSTDLVTDKAIRPDQKAGPDEALFGVLHFKAARTVRFPGRSRTFTA
ncbi:MAG: hypothetical protein ACLRM8_02235 [Alistipes sp.]